MHFPAVIGHTN